MSHFKSSYSFISFFHFFYSFLFFFRCVTVDLWSPRCAASITRVIIIIIDISWPMNNSYLFFFPLFVHCTVDLWSAYLLVGLGSSQNTAATAAAAAVMMVCLCKWEKKLYTYLSRCVPFFLSCCVTPAEKKKKKNNNKKKRPTEWTGLHTRERYIVPTVHTTRHTHTQKKEPWM